MKFKSAKVVLIIEIVMICIFHAVKISNKTRSPLKNEVLTLSFDKRNVFFTKYSPGNLKW